MSGQYKPLTLPPSPHRCRYRNPPEDDAHSSPQVPRDLVSRRDQRVLLLAVLTLLLTIIVCLIFICGLLLVDSYSAFQRWRVHADTSHDARLVIESEHLGLNYTALLGEIARDYPPTDAEAAFRRLRLINCGHTERVRLVEPVGAGWTKTVYRGLLDDGTPVALKTVSAGSHDVAKCQMSGNTVRACYERSARKFLHEVWLMLNFQHPNIVRMIGVCLPGDGTRTNHVLSSVVELGEPVDLIRLLQMPWDERLRIFYDLTNLLVFLSDTRLGSMVLDDFRRQQFVLVNGRLKLTDLDDLHSHLRPCRHHSQCTIIGKVTEETPNSQSRMKLMGRCVAGFCDRWNERMNLHRNYIQFGSFLLSHGNPHGLEHLIETYKHNSLKGKLTLPWLQRITNDLIEIYKSGRHLNRTQTVPKAGYAAINNTDASPADSLWCVQRYGCRLTVFDITEAEDACSAARDCIGFVVSKERSWLNHSIVYLKTKQSKPRPYSGHTLFLKPTINQDLE